MKLPFWNQPKGRNLFDDTPFWGTPDDFSAGYKKVENGETKGKLLNETAQSEEDKV